MDGGHGRNQALSPAGGDFRIWGRCGREEGPCTRHVAARGLQGRHLFHLLVVETCCSVR